MSDWEENSRTPMSTPLRPSFALRSQQSVIRPLEITVLHANPRATAKALRQAALLTRDLPAEIRLLVLQVVPYPLPIEAPDVSMDFTRKSLMEMIAPINIDVRVDIRLGRETSVMLESAFAPASLILAGSRRRWWPTTGNKIARRLQRLGHHVIAQDAE